MDTDKIVETAYFHVEHGNLHIQVAITNEGIILDLFEDGDEVGTAAATYEEIFPDLHDNDDQDEEEDPNESVQVPAGTYWVGDPGYGIYGGTVDNDPWIAALENADYMSNRRILQSTLTGHEFVASTTAYGDGSYHDQEGRTYPVDAGLLGVCRVVEGDPTPRGMHLVDFPEDFTVTYNNGVIHIGHLTIETR